MHRQSAGNIGTTTTANDKPVAALVGSRVWCGSRRGFVGDAISFRRDGRIAAIGVAKEILSGLSRRHDVYEVDGTIAPGFVDAHTHVRAAAAARLAVDCSADRTLAALLETVRAAAAGAGPGEWVSLVGFESSGFQPRLPERTELDLVAPGHPVRIRHRSLHGWLLNGSAAARVSGRIGREVEDGLLLDHDGVIGRAMGKVSSSRSFERAIRDWSEERLRQGVVAMLDVSVSNRREEIAALGRWRQDGLLNQEIGALTGEIGVEAKGLKVMPDEMQLSRSELVDQLRSGWEQHETVAVHCVEVETLGTLIEAVRSIPPDERRRLRIEHASLCPEPWLPQVASIGAWVVTHPAFIARHGDRYLRSLSEPTLSWLYRLRSWLRHGVKLAVGSDEPAGPGDPLVGWRAAISRRTSAGTSIGSEERLGRGEAFAAMTEWAARASDFDGYGLLEPGYVGAAVVLSGDPFSVGASLADVTIEAVYKGNTLHV